MAVKVGTTTVIDDSFKLQNIAGANGRYDNFQANVSTLTSSSSVAVSMDKPFMQLAMASNATLDLQDLAAGKTSILALDTSTNAWTPSFSSNVEWAEDAEPVWTDYRYWNIAFVSWDASVVRAAAIGFNS